MGLSLVVGPAHAGKVALLLERFLAALDRDPWLIVPNRVDVDRVERELAGRGGALLAGTIGTFDTLFAHLAGNGPASESARRGRAHDRAAPHRRRRRTWRRSGRRRDSPASRTLSPQLWPRSRRACSSRTISTPDLARSTAAYRAELARLGVCDRGMVRRRAVERLDDRPRLVGGRAGVRLRVRGPDRRRMAPDRGARRPGRGACLPPVRARPGCVRLARHELPRISARSPTGHRRARSPARSGISRAVSPTSNAASSTTRAQSVALDSSIRFLEGAGRRATLELVAETILDLVRDGIAPEEIAVVCPSARPLACVDRDRIRLARRPDRDREPAKARGDRVRPGAPLAAPLRLGQRHPPRALRLPAHAVCRPRTPGCRLPRGQAPRTRRAPRRPHAGGDDEAPQRPPASRCWISLHPRSSRCAPLGPSVLAMLRNAYGLGAPPATDGTRSATSARPRRSRGCSTSWSASRAAASSIPADDVALCSRSGDRARRRRGRTGPRCGSRPGTCPHAELRGRLRDRPRAGIATSAGADVSVSRRRGATRSRRHTWRTAPATRSGQSRPIPLLHRMHSAPKASHARSRGGDRRRLAAGGEPVLGGRLRALRRRRRTASHDPPAARPPDVADRVGADGTRAPSRVGAPRSRRPARSRRTRVCERLAAQARPGAARLLATNGDPSSARRGTARQPGDVPRHGSRADGGLLVGLVHRALPPPG